MAGTFPLPEAQLDRFLVALSFGYPAFEDEVMILEREESGDPLDAITPVVGLDEIAALQKATLDISVMRSLKEYIVSLTTASRTHADVVLGVSPRGGAALQRCAQALALIHNRRFVTPDDIKQAAQAVMPHRILARDRRPETARAVVNQLLQQVRVPVE
jgi:MoxR-like ATPase